MKLLSFLAWFTLNVGVPLLAPIALLPLLALSDRHRRDIGVLIRRSIDGGQLLWTTIALNAAGCYEAAGKLDVTASADDIRQSAVEMFCLLGVHVIFIIVASVVVLLVTMEASRARVASGRVITLSIWMSAASAFSLSLSHG